MGSLIFYFFRYNLYLVKTLYFVLKNLLLFDILLLIYLGIYRGKDNGRYLFLSQGTCPIAVLIGYKYFEIPLLASILCIGVFVLYYFILEFDICMKVITVLNTCFLSGFTLYMLFITNNKNIILWVILGIIISLVICLGVFYFSVCYDLHTVLVLYVLIGYFLFVMNIINLFSMDITEMNPVSYIIRIFISYCILIVLGYFVFIKYT